MVSAAYVVKKRCHPVASWGDVMNMCTEQVSKYFPREKGLSYHRDKDGAAGVVSERSQPFPDVFLEVLPHNILKNELRVRFATQIPSSQARLLVFSLCLAGLVTTHIESDPPDVVAQGQNQLAVYHYSTVRGESVFQRGELSMVNICISFETLERLYGKDPTQPWLLRTSDRKKLHIQVVTAPLLLLEAGRRLILPPVKGQAKDMYRRGACLEFLALALESLQKLSGAAAPMLLSQQDMAQLTLVKRQIERSFEQPPSLQELSKMFILNEYKLKKGFKQLFGMSVSGYVQFCRVNHAYKRFLDGESNVSQCAWEAGYTNVSHFITAFRKHYGCTPGKFILRQKDIITRLSMPG